MHPGQKLVEQCKKNNLRAQKEFYELFASKMFGICIRYARNQADAEDILQDCFIKIFSKIHEFRFEGSLEGWIRRTVVNTSINFYHKKSREWENAGMEVLVKAESMLDDVIDDLSIQEMIEVLQSLPDIYRSVFNLSIIEGYMHQEISEMLGIPENTSKSYLLRARKMMQMKINELNKISTT
jgi:RNA polymerase sigma factor (sigma-70 family)